MYIYIYIYIIGVCIYINDGSGSLQAGGEERAQEPREAPVARIDGREGLRKAVDFRRFFWIFSMVRLCLAGWNAFS